VVPDKIERERIIAAPVERVWALLTQAEHLGRWLGDAGAEIDLRPGGALTLNWTRYGTSHRADRGGRAADALRLPVGAVQGSGRRGAGRGQLDARRVHPRPGDEGTRLRVVESGFASLATSDDQRARNHQSNTRGWADELGELVEYAQKVAA
jgi:uncharacterized protein YndB with AHSA1/START domain